jgi:minor pilin subunit PapF
MTLKKNKLIPWVFFFTFSSFAVDVPINISGIIKIAPCIINKNEKITFNFKAIQVQNIDNHYGAVTKELPIECQYYQGKPYVNVIGNRLENAPNNVLKTQGNTGLGIALYQGSTINASYPIPIGNSSSELGVQITNGLVGQGQTQGTFSITAVPYAENISDLAPGKFESTAKIIITYN